MLLCRFKPGICALLFLFFPFFSHDACSQPEQKRIVSYVAGWATKPEFGLNISRIPGNLLTHINYAFVSVSSKGTCYVPAPSLDGPNFAALRALRDRFPHLKLLISLGGGSSTGGFRTGAASAAGRHRFAQSCVGLMKEIDFDGIDVDWEFPANTAEKKNYALLLGELRQRLAQEQLLTIAAPAGRRYIADVPWKEIEQTVDWINLMTYDYSWSAAPDSNAGLNAPLYPPHGGASENSELSVHGTVQTYLKAGISPEKLLLGIPFYGRGWDGVPAARDSFTGHLRTAGGGVLNGKAFYFRDIKKNHLGAFERRWHEKARVPWLYDASSRTMISYDDEESISEKADYAMSKRLGGLMIWEISKDDDSNSLLSTVASRVQGSI